jgi:phosphoribosylaminoimidazole carboxylase (NCAIR synthetase)
MLGKAAKKLEIPFAALSLPDAWDWLKSARADQHIVTFEQEHVDELLLRQLEAKGIPSFPSWASFEHLKSKRRQKEFLVSSGIPTSPFLPWGTGVDAFLREHDGGVLKAGRGGYDGKGVWLLDAHNRTKDGESGAAIATRAEQPYLEPTMCSSTRSHPACTTAGISQSTCAPAPSSRTTCARA